MIGTHAWYRWLAPVLVAALLAAGCGGKETPAEKDKGKPAATNTAAPAKPVVVAPVAAPAVPAAEQKALAEVVGMIPADAVALGTFRSPRVLVDQLNRCAGPEAATLPGVLLSFLPAEILDMDAPVAWAVMTTQEGPVVVIMARLKQGEDLKGENAGDGIVKLPGGQPPCAMKEGSWVVFGDGAQLKRFKKLTASPMFKVDEAVRTRLANDMAWVHFNIKPLTAMAKPKIDQWKAQAQQQAGAGQPSSEVKLAEWCQGLADQFNTLDMDFVIDEQHLVFRCDVGLADKGSLLALAQSMEPVDVYDGMLPETERFMAAGWANINYAKATPEMKAFLKPALDLLLDKFGEMAAKSAEAKPPAKGAEAAPNPMEALRASIDEQWKLADQYPDTFAGRSAVLVEIPEAGQGVYRTTQVHGLKDNAKYQVMARKSMSAAENMVKLITGAMPQAPDAPKMNMAVDYKAAAETIEGVPVDMMRFKFDLAPPANVPPGADMPFQMTKQMMETLYGKDGLSTRMAVVGNQAVVTIGPPDVMAQAIKRTRGQAGDLVRQKAVAEAISRIPPKSCAVVFVSCPAYAYTVGGLIGDPLLAMLPPERQKSLRAVPLPHMDKPALGDLSVLSMQVEGRTVRFQMDLPQSEIARTMPYLRNLYAHMMFDFFNIGMAMKPPAGMPSSMEGPTPPSVPPAGPDMFRKLPDKEPAVPVQPSHQPNT